MKSKKLNFFLSVVLISIFGCSEASVTSVAKPTTKNKSTEIVIVKKDSVAKIPENPKYPYTHSPLLKHVDSALYYANLGIRETGGNNMGFNNKYFQDKIYEQGWRKGASWCAYAVKTFLKMAGAIAPTNNGGLAQGFLKKETVSANDVKYGRKTIDTGYVAVWKHGDTYKGHTGIVYYWKLFIGIIIEGNTGPSGGSDGDGEYIKSRKYEPRNYFRIVGFTPVKY